MYFELKAEIVQTVSLIWLTFWVLPNFSSFCHFFMFFCCCFVLIFFFGKKDALLTLFSDDDFFFKCENRALKQLVKLNRSINKTITKINGPRANVNDWNRLCSRNVSHYDVIWESAFTSNRWIQVKRSKYNCKNFKWSNETDKSNRME